MVVKKKGAVTATAGSAAYFGVVVDDLFAGQWKDAWMVVEPTVKGVIVAAAVYAWVKWIDKDGDGVVDLFEDDDADVE